MTRDIISFELYNKILLNIWIRNSIINIFGRLLETGWLSCGPTVVNPALGLPTLERCRHHAFQVVVCHLNQLVVGCMLFNMIMFFWAYMCSMQSSWCQYHVSRTLWMCKFSALDFLWLHHTKNNALLSFIDYIDVFHPSTGTGTCRQCIWILFRRQTKIWSQIIGAWEQCIEEPCATDMMTS